MQSLGATMVSITSPNAASNSSILNFEFKRDLAAYFSRLPASAPMHTLADVIAYNNAHAQEALKYGQVTAIASQAVDINDPATIASYMTARDTGRAAAQKAINDALTNNNVEAIMGTGAALIALGAQAGYPELAVPAGYAATGRAPQGITFTGTAYSEAKLLAFGYAYEQKAQVRQPPSQVNPSMWRCVPGNAYTVTTQSCAPHDTANADVIAGTVGGTVPATLSLTLGTPAAFGAFTPGVAKEYSASMTANVISTAGDATLSVADPSSVATGHLVNGTFSLPQPLQGLGVVKTYAAPVSNDAVTITFKQAIGTTDALRTGSYSKTLTFTLSTTNP